MIELGKVDLNSSILLRSLERKKNLIKALSIRKIIEINKCFDNAGNIIALPIVFEGLKDFYSLRFKTKLNLDNDVINYLYIIGDLDALIKINEKPFYGVDQWTKTIPLLINDPEPLIEILVYPERIVGEKYNPIKINKIVLIEYDKEILEYTNLVENVIDLIKNIDDKDLRKELLVSLYKSMNEIHLQTPSPKQLLGINLLEKNALTIYPMLIDELLRMIKNKPQKLTEKGYGSINWEILRKEIRIAKKELVNKLEELIEKYPKRGTLHAVGHSHIDAAWLWLPEMTKWKILKTLARTLTLLKNSKKPIFIMSSALYFSWIKEAFSEIYREVKKMIEKNRIIPVSGMWVESDVIITPSETLVREFLYGQHFFEKELGKKCWIGWLPDSFGFSSNLPQIMKEAGIKFFVTHKPYWNEYNKFPYQVFVWEGIDGTRIPSFNIIGEFAKTGDTKSIIELWSNHEEKTIFPRLLYTYGYCDGGGGPTYEMLQRLEFHEKYSPKLPEIIHGEVESFYEELVKKLTEIPSWKGEIYLETHRGAYTTNTEIKKYVWLTDYTLRLLEQLSTWRKINSNNQSSSDNKKHWEIQLLGVFHDVISGTITHEVHEYFIKKYNEILNEMNKEIRELLIDLTGNFKGLIIYNPLQWDITEDIEVNIDPNYILDYQDQVLINNEKVLIEATIPGNGYIVIPLIKRENKNNLSIEPIEKRTQIVKDEVLIKTRFFEIKINCKGEITSIKDRETGFEYIASPSNKYIVYEDVPNEWDAWNIDEHTLYHGEELKPIKTVIVEDNELRKVIKTLYDYNGSNVEAYIYIYNNIRRIDFKVLIKNWKHRMRLLKTWFYTTIKADYYVADTPYGLTKRPTHHNTSVERAMFEAPILSWMYIEDGKHGIGLVSPYKHGISVKDSCIGLSLLKTPIIPDPLSDSDNTIIEYSLIPYSGGWISSKAYIEAYKVVNPLYWVINYTGENLGYIIDKLIDVEGEGIVLTTIKESEDKKGVLLRLYDISGTSGEFIIRTEFPIRKAYRVNILEEKILEISVNNQSIIKYRHKPYEIISIYIEK